MRFGTASPTIPTSNLVYVGTGNAEPWHQKFRGAQNVDNLYTCSILAVDLAIRTAQVVFPDHAERQLGLRQRPAADAARSEHQRAKQRKVITQASKNGFFWVLDRMTGEFISGAPYVKTTWALGLNAKGRPIVNPAAYYDKDPIALFPTGGGAHNWSPMSYSPMTGWVYIPVFLQPFTYAALDEVKPNTNGYTRGNVDPKLIDSPAIGPPTAEGMRTALEAWDPVNQKLMWRIEGGGGIGGGTVATAGNLVFQVINDGRFRAVTADKGEILYEIKTGRTGMAPPITYEVDGKQYVAFQGGLGRLATIVGANDEKVDNPPIMFVFALDGTAEMPKAAPPPPPNNRPAPAPGTKTVKVSCNQLLAGVYFIYARLCRSTMWSLTRRTFLKAGTASLAVARYAFAQSPNPNITTAPLGDNLYLLGGAGCNVIARTGPDGVVMVDGGLAQNAAALAQAVAALPNSGPVRTLFNTHWHPEQTGSNLDARHGRRHHHRPREHAALADGKHHLALERAEIPEASQDRPAQQDLLRQGRARFRNPLRIHLRRRAHRRRSLRLLPAAERPGGGRRRLRTRLAGGGLVDRRLDWRHCRRTAAHPERGEQSDTKIVPAQGPLLSFADIATQLDMYGTIYDRLNQMLNKGHSPSKPSRPSRPRNTKPRWATPMNSFAALSRACGPIFLQTLKDSCQACDIFTIR